MRFALPAAALAAIFAVTASVGQSDDHVIDPRAAALVAQGRAALASGQGEQAVDAFEAALTVDPAATAIYLDLAEVSADLGRTLDPRVLLETDADDAAAGFVREWRPEVFPPARHYAYAFTWFAFCLVVVATFVGLHWKGPTAKRRRDDGAKPEH